MPRSVPLIGILSVRLDPVIDRLRRECGDLGMAASRLRSASLATCRAVQWRCVSFGSSCSRSRYRLASIAVNALLNDRVGTVPERDELQMPFVTQRVLRDLHTGSQFSSQNAVDVVPGDPQIHCSTTYR